MPCSAGEHHLADPAGAAWRQTTFFPFALTARHARGEVLRVQPEGPTYPTTLYGNMPAIDATATHDPDSGGITVLLVNRHPDQPVWVEVGIGAVGGVRVLEASALSGTDPSAVNTEQNPYRVVPTPIQVTVNWATLGIELPPVAWACILLAPDRTGRRRRRLG